MIKPAKSNLKRALEFDNLLKSIGDEVIHLSKDWNLENPIYVSYDPSTLSCTYNTTFGEVKILFEQFTDNEYIVNKYPWMQKATIYNTWFTVAGQDIQAVKTTYKELSKICSTNFKILIDFAEEYQPDIILIGGNRKLHEKGKGIKHRLLAAWIPS